jgi:hypothetical protein
MVDVAQYRFLPWTRRGLAAEIGPASGADLPARATVRVGVTVSGVGDAPPVDLTLYGPGDVLGIDTRLIVRTDPRPHASDVEPNYLAAIEFDLPDLPWMFTPARPDGQQRLQPWLVLVVLDRNVVAPPRVASGQPLPSVVVPGAAVGTELPDLAESWGWAHTQVTRSDDGPAVTGPDLKQEPLLNVSRLLSPRRLQAGHSYLACLVPAFDVGVFRGLTGQQPAAATVGPAWDPTTSSDVTLPVYFHWEFSTGPAGDFEELARRLEPFACPPTVGAAPMHVGQAGPGLPVRDADEPGGQLAMEGALHAPSRSPGQLSEVVADLRDGLRAAVDAAADLAEGTAGAATPAIGPPLYGGWHANADRVPANRPTWLRELNLDPRARAAAAIATEVVKDNQEDLMHAAWEQVGDVLEANALLNRARLAEEAARRLRERHILPLPDDRLLALTRGAHTHVPLDAVTVTAKVAGTSLPDAATDPALRRLTSSQRPMLRQAARRAEVPLDQVGGFTSTLITTLAAGTPAVDPSAGFVPDGLSALAGLAELTLPQGNNPVDLAGAGLPLSIGAKDVREARRRTAALAGVDQVEIAIRPDLAQVGLITEVHLAHARVTGHAPGQGLDVDVSGILDRLLDAARGNRGAAAFLIDATGTATTVRALDVTPRGDVVVRTDVRSSSPTIGRLSTGVDRGSSAAVTSALSNLTPGVLRSRVPRGGELPVVEPPSVGTPGPATEGLTNTLPPPVIDAQAITRFRTAATELLASQIVTNEPVSRTLVPFDVAAAAATISATLDPTVMVPRRIATMLHAAGHGLLDNVLDALFVPPSHDRVWASPELPTPLYRLLTAYDSDRFLPGVDAIPNNAVTLLETNPRFVEAFLLGANHEMNRELLWRGYPTDQRGTPLRHFWDWLDGGPDIQRIHTWHAGRGLGSNTRGGSGGQLVLLLRGELLRRYPNTVIYAWRADNGRLKDPPGPSDRADPVFAGRFDPDFSFVGFDLTEEDLAGDGWFFVLQEQPTEPRFGLDEGAAPATLGSWSDLSWDAVGTPPGGHLTLAAGSLVGRSFDGATWVTNGAHLAAITLQRPVRVAVLSRHLLV